MMTKIFEKPQAILRVREILDFHKPRSVLLLCGNTSYEICGAKSVLDPQLDGYKVHALSGFHKRVLLEDLQKAVDAVKNNNCDFILAVGGGTVMDIAKTAALLSSEKMPLQDYIKGSRIPERKSIIRLLIPTTAGTGAEITPFAVVYIDKIKNSFVHPLMRPDYVIIAPELTNTLNPKITAETGCDALSQAIEGFWSVRATQESRRYSAEAINLILDNFVVAVNHPTYESRTAMLKAANLSGKSIAIARTTSAHALSYPLTAYHNIPHGHAVMLTLPYFFPINDNVNEENIQNKSNLTVQEVKNVMKKLHALLGVQNAEEAKKMLLRLMDCLNLEQRMSRLGIKAHDVSNLITNAFNPQRVLNNPVRISEKMVKNIFDTII